MQVCYLPGRQGGERAMVVVSVIIAMAALPDKSERPSLATRSPWFCCKSGCSRDSPMACWTVDCGRLSGGAFDTKDVCTAEWLLCSVLTPASRLAIASELRAAQDKKSSAEYLVELCLRSCLRKPPH